MARGMTPRTWMLGAGAGALLLVGGVAANPLDDWNEQADPLPPTEPRISLEDVLRIAAEEHPDVAPLEIELENEGGLVYGVEFSDGFEVELDADTGEILETEQEDEAEDDEAAQPVDVPALSFMEVREIALDAGGDADAEVLGIELENENGQLVYSVELSTGAEVEIDADTGEIIGIEQEDEDDVEQGELEEDEE